MHNGPMLSRTTFRSSLVALLFVSAACGSGDDEQQSADAGDGDQLADAAPGTPDAGDVNAEWSRLVDGSWEIPAATEFYKCARLTVQEDTYISGFKSIGPLGTHHTVLTVGAPSGPDGITDCDAGTNANTMIFGSGIGESLFHFPAGVGVKIPAGQQLVLNLHLFNVSDAPITGTSGTDVQLTTAANIEFEAESVLMGKAIGLQVAPGPVEQVGTCTMSQDFTLLTIAPHMHQLGSHMKVEALRGNSTEMLHDEAYDFYDQKLYELEPVSMSQGDKVRVTCGYNNTTGQMVGFGDSSEEEMCFAGMYRYPKAPSTAFGFACIF